jgi:hypothetical protein
MGRVVSRARSVIGETVAEMHDPSDPAAVVLGNQPYDESYQQVLDNCCLLVRDLNLDKEGEHHLKVNSDLLVVLP